MGESSEASALWKESELVIKRGPATRGVDAQMEQQPLRRYGSWESWGPGVSYISRDSDKEGRKGSRSFTPMGATESFYRRLISVAVQVRHDGLDSTHLRIVALNTQTEGMTQEQTHTARVPQECEDFVNEKAKGSLAAAQGDGDVPDDRPPTSTPV